MIQINVDPGTQGIHLEQYFGAYAIEEGFMDRTLGMVAETDMGEHVRVAKIVAAGPMAEVSNKRPLYTIEEGVAVFELVGSMTKYGSSLSSAPGSAELAAGIREATRNDRVKAILLKIDSPGGTVSGTSDLGDAVFEARQSKRVVAYVDDMAASAAYWVASQADHVVANSTAVVGSIGVFTMLVDATEANAKRGIKLHVIRSGKFKAIGAGNEAIGEEQVAEVQNTIMQFHDLFVGAIARGRGIDAAAVAGWADGRTHIGQTAVDLGLVDALGTYDSVFTSLVNDERRSIMSETAQGEQPKAAANTPIPQAEPKAAGPATFAELKAACPGASADFICAQQEADATVAQATRAFMEHQAAQIAELQASAKRPATPGNDAVSDAPGTKAGAPEGDPIGAFRAAVTEHVKAGKTHFEAVKMVAKEDPELHAEFLVATNPNHDRRFIEATRELVRGKK